MVLLILPWLFRNFDRPEYAALQASHGEDVSWEVGASAWWVLRMGILAAPLPLPAVQHLVQDACHCMWL